jgi:uncharacterized protein YcfL
MKLLAFIVLASLVLTGCGSEVKKEPKYDELDLIRYKVCLDYEISSGSKGDFSYSENMTDFIIEACEKYLPLKN